MTFGGGGKGGKMPGLPNPPLGLTPTTVIRQQQQQIKAQAKPLPDSTPRELKMEAGNTRMTGQPVWVGGQATPREMKVEAGKTRVAGQPTYHGLFVPQPRGFGAANYNPRGSFSLPVPVPSGGDTGDDVGRRATTLPLGAVTPIDRTAILSHVRGGRDWGPSI